MVKKVYHIQHVNSYHSELEDWFNRGFKGVTTKYMDNYLAWFRFLEISRDMDKNNRKKSLLTTIFKPYKARSVGGYLRLYYGGIEVSH